MSRSCFSCVGCLNLLGFPRNSSVCTSRILQLPLNCVTPHSYCVLRIAGHMQSSRERATGMRTLVSVGRWVMSSSVPSHPGGRNGMHVPLVWNE